MKHKLRSAVCTEGRRMAGARALWVANGMKREQFGKPIIAVVNSFTQFVPGHTHLHEIGQIVKQEIEKLGCYAAEFNTIAIDDGIAMGHDGMLYSLPSRDIIADSVEYIGRSAFSYQLNVSAIKLPKNLKSIGDYAFYQCSQLNFITLPKTLAKIGDFAFKDCYNLLYVYYEGNETDYEALGITGTNYVISDAKKFYNYNYEG